ncbi:MAG: serpin family protein [Tannerellaceae bacterium]|jgi:serpin B|nr:serpin family protein [Tannerellaceae bacterium]
MKRMIATMACIFAGLISCQTAGEPDPAFEEETPITEEEGIVAEGEPIVLTEAEQQIAQKNNLFAFDLLRTVYLNEKPGENILLSPLSASLALAMLNNGAAGKTHDEIQQTLGYGDLARDEMNGYFKKMVDGMKTVDPLVSFESANSIWIKNNFSILEAFKEINKNYFAAEVRNEDFSDPATVDLINGWCAEKTHDKIPDIIDGIPDGAIMYLINALYFKGIWTVQFDKEETADEPFSNLDGTTPLLPTMNMAQTFQHFEGETFDLLELPYGNESFAMLILLPKEGVALSSVIDALDGETWEKSLSRMYGKNVELKLPRFKIEYEKILNKDLFAMGMESMFGGADFSLMRPEKDVCVSMVKQKTFAEVNEEGTEAAAVTAIEMVVTSVGGDSPTLTPFYVNRPFLYFIKEKSTGTIFFTGVTKNL